LIDEILVEV